MSPLLNRPLLLEALARVPDGAGGYGESWQSLGTLWAAVVPGAGRAAGSDAAGRFVQPLKITVRAAPAGAVSRPLPGQRFRAGLRVFRILSVTEAAGDGRYLTCFAEEEGAA